MSNLDDESSKHGGAGWTLTAMGRIHGRAVHSRRVRVLAGHIAELLPAGHAVLDVGCGDGLIDALVLERRPDLSISGVDVLVREATRIPVSHFDGTHLPFADGSFDTVMFCDVLHHTVSPVAMLGEACRVSRECVLIKDHTVQGWLARPTLRFMDFVGNAPHGVVLPYNYLTPKEWEAAFHACGMVPRAVRRRLGLYPAGTDLLFGRSLHYLGLYDING